MKTYKQFNQDINEGPVAFAKGTLGNVFGKTWRGRGWRSMMFAPEKLGTSKVAKFAQPFYSAATDAAFTGPAAPVVFGTSLAARAYGPTLSKIGKKIEKNRVAHDNTVSKALKDSPSNKGKSAGEIEQQKNRYMGSIRGVNGPLYPGYNQKL